MTREDVIRIAGEAGFNLHHNPELYDCMVANYKSIERFAALVAAAEREACARSAGWLWQQFQDTKEAHERNSPEPFRPEQFGFDQSTVQQSKRIMDAIRARGQL
jgi:hypothetical protein